MYSLHIPGRVLVGQGSIRRLENLAAEYSRAALFTDNGVAAAGLCEPVMEALHAAGCQTEVINSIPPEPTVQQAWEAISDFRQTGASLIVGLGGGSVMDVAKLASLLPQGSPYTLRDLLEHPDVGRKSIPTFLIPTTAGTGAEATFNAIVAEPEKGVKTSIVCPEMTADAVLLDPDMTASLPRKFASASLADALAHAIECFTSNKATPLSDLYALEALRLILRHGEAGINLGDAAAREALLLAAFYGGAAIAGSGTTAVHALSYPLGGQFHVPHGIANAILLVPVMRFNEPCCRQRFAMAHDALRPEFAYLSAQAKSAWMLSQMEDFIDHIGIPKTFSSYGVVSAHAEALTDAGMQVTRLLSNNPRVVSREDALKIYQKVLE